MGFRFYRRIRLLPGVRLNVSRSGLSLSLGRPGLSYTIGRRGPSLAVGLPGTGISYQMRANRHRTQRTPTVGYPWPSSAPDWVRWIVWVAVLLTILVVLLPL